ncbi:hypothetical protein KBB05_03625 [Patescibacteria group bacterium]|nr:hypothetical protein [Patescibacteria group bacterium]
MIQKDLIDIDISSIEESKGNYDHFMIKEIFEQPAIIKRIMMGRVDFSTKTLMTEAFHGMADEQFKQIILVGCGTSYNAALL